MSRRPRIVVVGDGLLDRDLSGHVDRVCPDAPAPVVDLEEAASRPGGAGLTALLAAGEGADVTLVAPLGADADGRELQTLLEGGGVRVVGLGHDGPTRVKTRVRAAGQSIVRIDSGGPGRLLGGLTDEAARALEAADAVLVSCSGAGVTADAGVRAALAARARRRLVVWDPHPRGGDPVEGCALVTPNLGEARARAGLPDAPGDVLAARLRERWQVRAVAVTGGERGAWVATSAGEPLFAPATEAAGDPCGAGDRFAGAAAVALARGRTTSEAVTEAVARASEFVAAGGAAALAAAPRSVAAAVPTPEPGRSPRRTPGTGVLVATGGCFDVLHAGHVSLLEAARGLGDSLVVLLNSDASVRRLKGPGRPVNTAADRARTLLGLSCVDDVVVFDEDDPRTALDRLRPDIWTKGGDYEDAELPEAALVRSWGGRVVLLPYLSGRSSTAVLHAIHRGDHP